MTENQNPKIPTADECMELLKNYGTPAHVVRHCAAVARTAVCLATALNRSGDCLNEDLIRAAAFLHDIARTEPHHGPVGAAYVAEAGYPAVAALIEPHMVYMPEQPHVIREQDILCLADRMVKEDRYIGLEARMAQILEKKKAEPEVCKSIQSRILQTIKQRDFLEERIGQRIDDLAVSWENQNDSL